MARDSPVKRRDDGTRLEHRKELPMTWASTKPRHLQEWLYRDTPWTSSEQHRATGACQRPLTARGAVQKSSHKEASNNRPSSSRCASAKTRASTVTDAPVMGKPSPAFEISDPDGAEKKKAVHFTKEDVGVVSLRKWMTQAAEGDKSLDLLADACSARAKTVENTIRATLQARSPWGEAAGQQLKDYEREYEKLMSRKKASQNENVAMTPGAASMPEETSDIDAMKQGMDLTRQQALAGAAERRTANTTGIKNSKESYVRPGGKKGEWTAGTMSMEEARRMMSEIRADVHSICSAHEKKTLVEDVVGAKSPRMKKRGHKNGLQNWREKHRHAIVKSKAPAQVDLALQSVFAGATAQIRKIEEMTTESVNEWELQRIANSVNMPIAEVRFAKKVFDELDVNKNDALEYMEFEKLCLRVAGISTSQKEVRKICREQWATLAAKSNTVNFIHFLEWYSQQRFDEDTQALRLQELSHMYSVPVETIEGIRHSFNSVDTDHSGIIDYSEFQHVLYKIMRIPEHVDLPASRIQSLWMEMERSGDSKVSFEEFLPWWLRRRDTLLPIEGFYASIRCLDKQVLDPPAYPKKQHREEDKHDCLITEADLAESLAELFPEFEGY